MGYLEMYFSSPVKLKTFSRMRRSLQQSVESDGNGGLAIKARNHLILFGTILKLSEMVKIELVPANELYLDKKAFTWSLQLFEESKIEF